MGEAYHQKKQYNVAMVHYNMALELDSVNLWALTCEASLYYDMVNLDKALELYTKLIELDPSYYPSYFSRAGIYYDLDDYELAIADYETYLLFEPGDEDALYNIDAAEENMWEGY
jgi:tetratricopeptide (TPR) repeat protein